MKKVLSVVLALVLMLTTISVAVVANTEADCTMKANETRTVSLPGAVYDDYVIVRFVATGNGKVVISSSAASGETTKTSNPCLEVYKNSVKNANLIGDAENNGSYHNFKYELDCKAGTVYYLVMYNSLSAQSWNVSIACKHEAYSQDGYCLTCQSECPHVAGDNIVGCCPCGKVSDAITIEAGESFELESSTTRQWFKFIPEETAPYILHSDNNDDEATWSSIIADPAFIIVNYSGETVIANDANISAENKNFNFPYMFEKGTIYFIGVNADSILADDWTFTLASGTEHIVPVEKTILVEKKVPVIDETTGEQAKDPVTGELLFETVMKPVIDETTGEQAKDSVTGELLFEPEMVEETVIEYVTHKLTYSPHKDATCQADGHTPAVICEECKETIAGGDVIPKASECKDDDANNHCDWCDRVMVEIEPEDPTENCSCNCHKDGISKFFFDFILFFQKIFRLNSVCSCGVRHY